MLFLRRGTSFIGKGNSESERTKRIAFPSETYTFWARNVYVWGQVALPLMRRGFQKKKTHLTFPLYDVSDRSKGNQLETA